MTAGNEFEALPDMFGDLTNLRQLRLTGNYALLHLPPSITALTGLQLLVSPLLVERSRGCSCC